MSTHPAGQGVVLKEKNNMLKYLEKKEYICNGNNIFDAPGNAQNNNIRTNLAHTPKWILVDNKILCVTNNAFTNVIFCHKYSIMTHYPIIPAGHGCAQTPGPPRQP